MIKPFFVLLLIISLLSRIEAQNVIHLWPDEIPNSLVSDEEEVIPPRDILWIEKVHTPTLDIYIPSKKAATRQAMIICPGGGYVGLSQDWEGTDIAKFLNAKGVAAFVLKYRVPKSTHVKIGYKAPIQDAQRAIKTVRANAEKWNIDPDQIGIIGFSAGGHLASTAGTHFEDSYNDSMDDIDRQSAKPNFMALIYPVITMDQTYTHQGSKDQLLGDKPANELVASFSNERRVTNSTPATFLVHSTDDRAVPVENSLLFYKALKEAHVPVEMHIYSYGGHGYALAIGNGQLGGWSERLWEWLSNLKSK